ncbi:MAG: tyrosine-type recombinase/integrase [Bdellovibrionales bacterium]
MSNDDELYRFWKHPNGTYYVVWNERIEIAPGKFHTQTKRISTGTKLGRPAEEFRAQFIAGLKNPAPKDEPTIGYILDRYRNERAIYTRSLKTIDYVIKQLKPYFDHLLPSHLSNSLFNDFAKQQSVGPGTILRRLGVLKAAIHYAEGERWIERQPQFIMPVKSPPPRDLWLTREQIVLLIEKAKSDHIKLFIKIAVSTAARSGAILDLKWSQIDFNKRLIDFGPGHGNKRRAIVPMNDDVYEALITAKELAQTEYVIEYHSKPCKEVKVAFRRLCKGCNIKASAHTLRHTAATWMVMAGVPLAEVARVLGDSEKTVERVYGKHAPDYLRRAVSALSLNNNLPKLQP